MTRLKGRPRFPAGRTAFLFLAAAGLHFAAFDAFTQPLITDVAFFVHFAARTASGALPYVDFLDFKTPLSVFAGAVGFGAGEALGGYGVEGVRILYLFFAAATACALACCHARLAGRRAAAGWIALVLIFGIRLLGIFPSIGNVPKLLTVLCAAFALLAARRGRWIPAGGLVVLAFMDWQPGGGLAVIALGIMALAGRGRIAALVRAALGGLATLGIFAMYFALRGGLEAFWNLAFLAPFHRTAAGGDPEFEGRIERIGKLLASDCAGETWILYLAGAGLLVFPALLVLLRRRKPPEFPLGLGAGVFFAGLMGYALVDFQSHGDLFAVLWGTVFFAALPVWIVYQYLMFFMTRWVIRRRKGPSSARPALLLARRLRFALGLLLVAGLGAVTAPSFLKEGFRRGAPSGPAEFELCAQREVAHAFAEAHGGRRIACLDCQEALVLGRLDEVLGFVYYDPVIEAVLRDEAGPGGSAEDEAQGLGNRTARSESRIEDSDGRVGASGNRSTGAGNRPDPLLRRLDAARPDVVIPPQRSRQGKIRKGAFTRWLRRRGMVSTRLESEDGTYALRFWARPLAKKSEKED